MPRATEADHIILTYDMSFRDRHWFEMSTNIRNTYGSGPFKEHQDVQKILLAVFSFFTSSITAILSKQSSFYFYLYTFWLHEQSLEIHIKRRNGYNLKNCSVDEFVTYRRILKLVLEFGCDVNFSWPKDKKENNPIYFDSVLSEIIYLGRWAYHVADDIAYQNMIEDCHNIHFDDDGALVLDWNFHFGQAYNTLVQGVLSDYDSSVTDNNAIVELRDTLKKHLNIDLHFSLAQIEEIQKKHSPKGGSDLQTIEPYVLPLNLAASGASKTNADLYYNGLIVKRSNKLDIDKAIYKPYSTQRYLFRPILVYEIEGVERALVSLNKLSESFTVIATNAIQWNTLPIEWLKNHELNALMVKKGHEHDKLLEDAMEKILKELDLPFDRSIKSLKSSPHNSIQIRDQPGEIDFIVVNSKGKTVLVLEAKYNKARYEGVGYQAEYGQFLGYEKKLAKKVKWIEGNLAIVSTHLKVKKGISIDLSGYKVKGVFAINTPTFYMFNGEFEAVAIGKFSDYLTGKFGYGDMFLEDENNFMILGHPYFRKPIVFDPPDIEV